MVYRLKTYMPHKTFHALEGAECPNMKKITIDMLNESVKTLEPEVRLSDELIEKALLPLQRMVDIGRD